MDEYCSDCKQSTDVVVDHSSGDTICAQCGLVLEAWSIDETAEWRVFTDDSADGADPHRVGGRTNLLLADAPLTTFVTPANGGAGDFLTRKLHRFAPNSSANRTNLNLIKGFEAIATMCENLDLAETIKNRASEIFKKVEDQKAAYRFKNGDAILAACLHLACRQEGKNRTLKEICSVSNGVMPKEIGRAERYIAKLVPDMEIGVVGGIESGSLMMRRFGSYLRLNHKAVRAAQEAVGKSQELDIRRNPVSIAAAVIYMIAQLSDDKKSLKDVSDVTGVAQGTIRDSYKDLHPHLSKIVPTWFTQTAVKV